MKHTPGPWRIRGQDILGNELNGYICSWSGRTANAHLIAAAPEMYETLRWLVHLEMGVSKGGDDCPITTEEKLQAMKEATEALNKAEGRGGK